MKVHIKKSLLVSLLIGSCMITSHVTNAMDQARQQQNPTFNPKNPYHALGALAFIIPMWQCYRKSPKTQIPPEEEYSLKELGQSLGTLCHHYVTKPINWAFTRQPKYTNEQINNASHNLWHNIKNFYNTGIVGQKKYQKLMKAGNNGTIAWSESTPAVGLCGNLLDMAGDAEAILKKFFYFAGAGYLIYNIKNKGYPITELKL